MLALSCNIIIDWKTAGKRRRRESRDEERTLRSGRCLQPGRARRGRRLRGTRWRMRPCIQPRGRCYSSPTAKHLLTPPQAIMHTNNQLAAISHMRHASKAHGTISLHEGDMGLFFAYPENPGVKRWLETFPVLGLSKGADPYLGRKLVSLVLAAGYAHGQIKGVSMAAQMQWRPQVKPGLVMGFGQIIKTSELEEEDKKLIVEGLEEWSKCEDSIVSFPGVIVTAVKEA